ncbi:MAG TPA: hypothetical protein VIJ94_20410 [Caulobacteraceae bacterium]
MMRTRVLAGAAGLAALVVLGSGGALAQPAGPEVGPHGFPISQTPRPSYPIPANCDRACLEHVSDAVAHAMVSKDIASLPLSQDVRYTEGGQPLKVGEGFWATASAVGDYVHYFADPDVGEVVAMRTMREGHGPNADNLMSLRVRVQLGRITEIETTFYKKGSGPAWNDAGIDNLNKMRSAPAPWFEVVPPARRLTRQELIEDANFYFEGLQRNDGHGYYPFTSTCNRIENGVSTTNNTEVQKGQAFQPFSFGCKEQFSTGYYGVVTQITYRRYLVADPERGVVVAFATFKHAGTVPVVHLTNGTDYDMSFFSRPSSIQIVEAFKITPEGKLDLVEAVGGSAAYGLDPHWPGGLSGK